MATDPTLERTARLFKALSTPSRLRLIVGLQGGAQTVSQLVASTGLSQPLTSQHLASLRDIGVVSATRHGREMHYEIADSHIAHIVGDAIAHVDDDHENLDAVGKEEK